MSMLVVGVCQASISFAVWAAVFSEQFVVEFVAAKLAWFSVITLAVNGSELRLNCEGHAVLCASLFVIVGQNEDTLPLVRCADLARAENSSRRAVTHSFQFAEDMEQNGRSGGVAPSVPGELGADDSFDIFQENKGRSASLDSIEDVWEEVAGVEVCSSFACRAK